MNSTTESEKNASATEAPQLRVSATIYTPPGGSRHHPHDEVAPWSAPVELFCEISINVRDHSPYPHIFYLGYANGWLGYLPARQALAEGGRETRTNPCTEQ
jgi:hypothetical protein